MTPTGNSKKQSRSATESSPRIQPSVAFTRRLLACIGTSTRTLKRFTNTKLQRSWKTETRGLNGPRLWNRASVLVEELEPYEKELKVYSHGTSPAIPFVCRL